MQPARPHLIVAANLVGELARRVLDVRQVGSHAGPAVDQIQGDVDFLVLRHKLTPDQFTAQIKAEFEVYKEVVAKQKLKLE